VQLGGSNELYASSEVSAGCCGSQASTIFAQAFGPGKPWRPAADAQVAAAARRCGAADLQLRRRREPTSASRSLVHSGNKGSDKVNGEWGVAGQRRQAQRACHHAGLNASSVWQGARQWRVWVARAWRNLVVGPMKICRKETGGFPTRACSRLCALVNESKPFRACDSVSCCFCFSPH